MKFLSTFYCFCLFAFSSVAFAQSAATRIEAFIFLEDTPFLRIDTLCTGVTSILKTTQGTVCPTKIDIIGDKNQYCSKKNYGIMRHPYITDRKQNPDSGFVCLAQRGCHASDRDYACAWYGLSSKNSIIKSIFSSLYNDKPLPNSLTWGSNNCRPQTHVADVKPIAPTRTLTFYITKDIVAAQEDMKDLAKSRSRKEILNSSDSIVYLSDTAQNVAAILRKTTKPSDYTIFIRNQVNNVENSTIERILIQEIGVRYVAFIDKEADSSENRGILGTLGNEPRNNNIFDDQKTPAFFYFHLLPDSGISIKTILDWHYDKRNDWYSVAEKLSETANKNPKKPKLEFLIGFF
jgi:hypothetical protein